VSRKSGAVLAVREAVLAADLSYSDLLAAGESELTMLCRAVASLSERLSAVERGREEAVRNLEERLEELVSRAEEAADEARTSAEEAQEADQAAAKEQAEVNESTDLRLTNVEQALRRNLGDCLP